ncbi:hypothetical protein EDD15DRAFT_2359531 [Pisolithus albus]|nr:hypothetical protein EDD15DRAFT_2359531 [Pisolithus albus]
MSVGMMSSLLTSNESNGSLLTSPSPTSATFQSSFPLPNAPDLNFSQGNEMAMTTFPTFMNGAYSHESKQLSLLQERAKLLEGQVMKLTVENNTLRMAFQWLAGAVGLRDVDPCQVDSTTFPAVSASLKSKVDLARPTPADYPSIRFWDREDWDKYLESPEGQTSKRGTMGYLEDKDGNPPSRETAKAIRKLLRGGWVELVHKELAPPSWGRLAAGARQFIHGLMESTYPHFKFANNGWKLDYLASNTYPAWRKGKLDDNGKWKQKKGKGCKVEDDDDNDDDDDDSSDEVGMKRKALALKLEESGPGKRFKGKHGDDDDQTPSSSGASLSPPASDTSTSSLEPSTEGECAGGVSIDPLAALAIAAGKVRDIPELPPLDTSQGLPSGSTCSNNVPSNAKPILELEDAVLPAATPTLSTVPTMVDNAPVASVVKPAKGGGKAKMRPGPAKNGRNLCAHCWRKQVQSSGSTEEFQRYYTGLTSAQRQAYDDEAAVLDSAPKQRKYDILQGFIGKYDNICFTFTATLKVIIRHTGSHPYLIRDTEGKCVGLATAPLRAVDGILMDKLRVECILDSGCQVVALRHELWEALGAPLCSDMRMTLEVANQSKESTLGVIENASLRIGPVEAHLQIQVVDRAPFDLYGEQSLEIRDPNTRRQLLILTRPRHRLHHQSRFVNAEDEAEYFSRQEYCCHLEGADQGF